MATANIIWIGGVPYAPGHPMALANKLPVKIAQNPSTYSKKRVRQSSRTMNKLETEFYERLKLSFDNVYYEPMRMKLCNGVAFIPDFMVIRKISDSCTSVVFFEVKGNQPIQDDASVKIKMAAQQYRLFKFVLCWKKDGQWREQSILP